MEAWRLGATAVPPLETVAGLPVDLSGVWRFYRPLANSMLVVWGGRALLLGVIARAQDGLTALAAWPTAWGFVLVVSNATRMVQQVVIRNRSQLDASVLARFVAAVGGACSALLLAIAATDWGARLLDGFVGYDAELLARVRPAILLCSAVPLIVAVQNALQGLAIGAGKTQRVNQATWGGTLVLLLGAWGAPSTADCLEPPPRPPP